MVGLVTNEGRRDGKTVGAAAAVMPIGWRVRERHEVYDQAYELGEGVTQYDVDAFRISLAGRAILAYLRDGGPARRFTILLRSQSAISGIANLNSRSEFRSHL